MGVFRLEHNIRIEEGPEVVWAFLANLPVSLTCHRSRRRFQWLGSSKPGLDSRYAVELTLPGIRLRQEGRVTRWEPPHSLAVAQWSRRHPHRGFSPPMAGFSHQQRLSVQPVEGWPQATVLQSTIVGSLVPWFVEAAFRPVIHRYMLSHLAALKRAIESTDKSSRTQRDSRGRLAEMPAVGAG